METIVNLVKWLQENVDQCENSSLYLCDLERKLEDKLNGQETGRAIQHVFGKIVVKTARNKSYWLKFTKQYFGLTWKNKCINNETLHDAGESVNDKTGLVSLTEDNHRDMIKVLESITEDVNIPEKMLVLLRSQLVSMKQSHSKCKWDPQIIRMFLSIYCRSHRAYQDLANSGFLVLPSKRQIQRYKNKIDQQTGISKSNLKWMLSEIKLRKLPEDGYEGGLLMDEMAIQEDIQLKKTGDEFEIVGFVECCDETLYMDRLMKKTDLKMATHVLQILFLGNTGFRFPVGHFATLQASPAEMYLVFWEAVKMLGTFGFTVTYISLDGAQNNRLFMKMLLPDNKVTSKTMNTVTH